jgi:hypothetical protein
MNPMPPAESRRPVLIFVGFTVAFSSVFIF